jgi:hypothetical protein
MDKEMVQPGHETTVSSTLIDGPSVATAGQFAAIAIRLERERDELLDACKQALTWLNTHVEIGTTAATTIDGVLRDAIATAEGRS